MAEGTTHRRIKAKAAGKSGRTEVRISGNTRLDAFTRSKAVEVETSGQPERLEKAARRRRLVGVAGFGPRRDRDLRQGPCPAIEEGVSPLLVGSRGETVFPSPFVSLFGRFNTCLAVAGRVLMS